MFSILQLALRFPETEHQKLIGASPTPPLLPKQTLNP